MKVFTPWTRQQAENLNAWQRCDWVHGFTCINDRTNEDHRLVAELLGFGDPGTLIATRLGWRCPACGYAQDWAHDFMMQGPPPRPVLDPGGEANKE